MNDIELNYPRELPVCAMREAVIDAVRRHPVVVVSGDTGSGKTTQLPKMMLELGRGVRGRRIVCTQPRRLAAVTVAERVASELKCETGGLVGYRHRFARRMSAETRVEFATDGILLAETRRDPLLKAYDTVIVDEAHERSLNTDFLLGILKRALERRSDLKVIISSATLDAGRFAEFFGDAATISVPGRLFPIEVRHMPPPEDEERDLARDVEAAVSALPADADILVFLPGERDIRETAEHLSNLRGATDDILPLFSSLPSGEQRRAFAPSSRRKIILATNVAETSLTIPGIRAVIDSGLARISRYIHRTGIQRLQIEPVSKASVRQRTGRCGRTGPGICIRLYSRDDYESREEYTPPEILRSSLAGVILSMLDLRLGDIDRFPFIDAPKPAMVREGLRELIELGAIRRAESGGAELTENGRKLAGIPVEPRLARILLEASRNAVTGAVIPLVASMACDDPRRRPFEEREKANALHARFKVPDSDFMGTLSLWNWWKRETEGLSESKARRLCKANYLSYPKMREWRDLARQLETLACRLGLCGGDSGKEDHDLIHRSLLAGLLSRIGKFDEEKRDYRGARALRFAVHPSSALKRKPWPWIMAGELVDTERLFARNAAAIDPRWIEPVAGAACRRSYHSPEWDARSGFVRATEQVTLYGLVIVPARRCDYSRIDPVRAREIFIRRGIVDGEFPRPPPAVRKNLEVIASLRQRAERIRRFDAFDADGLERFFERTIPPGIASADQLRRWLGRADESEVRRFILRESDWLKNIRDDGFPEVLVIAGRKIRLSYRHDPDDPETDGVTCTVKNSDADVLGLWRSDWLVPGMIPEKLRWHLSSLPSQYRRLLSPIDDAADILLPLLKPGSAPFADELCRAVRERWGFAIPRQAWHEEKLPPHLRMRFRIIGDDGKPLIVTRDKDKIAPAEKTARAKAAAKSVSWTFGDIPEHSGGDGAQARLYYALRDEGDGVSLRLFGDALAAASAHDAGVTRLFTVALSKTVRIPFRGAGAGFSAALYLKNLGYADDDITADLLYGAVSETMVRGKTAVRTLREFEKRLEDARSEVPATLSLMHQLFKSAAIRAAEISNTLEDGRLDEMTADSVSTQLSWLIYRGFPRNVALSTLKNYSRYLEGAAIRLMRARTNRSGDLKKEAVFSPYWERYREAVRPENSKGMNRKALIEYRWMLEEFRISLFAQELHTPEPVSPKRLDAKWREVTAANRDTP